jgi:hypothetical protein
MQGACHPVSAGTLPGQGRLAEGRLPRACCKRAAFSRSISACAVRSAASSAAAASASPRASVYASFSAAACAWPARLPPGGKGGSFRVWSMGGHGRVARKAHPAPLKAGLRHSFNNTTYEHKQKPPPVTCTLTLGTGP